jgi:hypothetical protein
LIAINEVIAKIRTTVTGGEPVYFACSFVKKDGSIKHIKKASLGVVQSAKQHSTNTAEKGLKYQLRDIDAIVITNYDTEPPKPNTIVFWHLLTYNNQPIFF